MIKSPTVTAGGSATEEQSPARQPEIIIVTNWFEELKERVPAD